MKVNVLSKVVEKIVKGDKYSKEIRENVKKKWNLKIYLTIGFADNRNFNSALDYSSEYNVFHSF